MRVGRSWLNCLPSLLISHDYAVLRSAKKKISPTISSSNASKTRHGMAPWRGIAEVFAVVVFFLIFGEATDWTERAYFLNKLSKAARASVALRGACTAPWSPFLTTAPEGSASRATVTLGENSSQVLA